MTAEVLLRIKRDTGAKLGVFHDIDENTIHWDTSSIRDHFAIIRAVGNTPVVMQIRKGTAAPVDGIAAMATVDPCVLASPTMRARRWAPCGLFGFDEVMLVPPSLFRVSLDKPTLWMGEVAWKAVATYRCEHPVEETESEADAHMRLLRADWKRPPEPFTRMRFAREKTRIHSTGGKRRAIFSWAEVQRIFGTLATDDGFMELENYECEEARIEHRGGYTVSFRGVEKSLAPGAAKAWLETFAIRGADEAAKALDA